MHQAMRFVRGPFPPTADLGAARRTLLAYEPPDAAQQAIRDRMLAFIDAHPEDAHLRTCLPGHFTGSALVLDSEEQRVLLTYHRKLECWLQLGGHADGDANLAGVAFREAVEESGITDLAIDPAPVDLDIHVIAARRGEPEHLHLDARFLLRAGPGAVPSMSSESLDLRWFTPRDLASIDVDDSLGRLFRIAFG